MFVNQGTCRLPADVAEPHKVIDLVGWRVYEPPILLDRLLALGCIVLKHRRGPIHTTPCNALIVPGRNRWQAAQPKLQRMRSPAAHGQWRPG
jgi:hypothetical protein